MTNGEARMTNQTANPNDESALMPGSGPSTMLGTALSPGAPGSKGGRSAVSSLLLFRHSFVIRVSGFAIPTPDAGSASTSCFETGGGA